MEGIIVVPDDLRGLKKVADDGDVIAQYRYGRRLTDFGNYMEAVKYFKLAAD